MATCTQNASGNSSMSSNVASRWMTPKTMSVARKILRDFVKEQ
jgi:hypothetical protein